MSDLPTELVEMDARALPLGFANGSVTSVRIVGSTLCRVLSNIFVAVFNQQIGEHVPFQDSGMFSRSVETTN